VTLREYAPLLDSAAMIPANWEGIAEDIARNYAAFDGFVVLHGTDTMAYSASALSFMLENLGKPVILTGSQIPLAELRSDARENLITALLLAAHAPLYEVGLISSACCCAATARARLPRWGPGRSRRPTRRRWVRSASTSRLRGRCCYRRRPRRSA
jgi:L-asparaginase/Glu-tRNA(Gln) amidotransferase subunit D